MKALFVSFVILVLFSCQIRTGEEKTSLESLQSEPIEIIGKTIEYRYGESVYHVTIDSESEMHWEAITGDEKGVQEEETYKMEYLDHQTIFITWGEANGIGVSQVLDFKNGVVHNHLLRGREVSIGKGKIRIL